ncbi:MAG: hypothetical protein JNK09_10905 [Prolixibacteraceae bacterium]|nr:hypothetical protein [Prolixibacteraceae bacterium]
MKKKISSPENKQGTKSEENLISRKEAIKKTGYIAVSAATMMLLLNTNAEAHASQPAPPPPTNNNGGKGGGIWKK